MISRLSLVWSLILFANLINGEPTKPNIVILFADDMGWGDLGANLPHLPSSTPFLDSLANNGIRFQDFHSSASVCTPSRAALLTGRLGLRTGVVENFVPDSVGGLPREEITLAKILKTVGYRTAAIGKWHLGLTSGHHPLDHGFDTYLGVPFSLDMGCTTPPGFDLPPKQSCFHSWINGTKTFSKTALPLMKDKEIVHQPVKLSSLAQMYAEFGVDFITKDSETPALVYAAFSHIHVPLAHGKNFSNATGGILSNCLKEMDWIADKLITASGINKTLVWFLSDNGPWEYKCSLAGTAGPYKGTWQKLATGGGGGSGSKTTIWEGGHRVPAFVHWSTKIKKAQVSNALLSATDIVPTIASITGASLPEHHIYDGIDISSIINGERNIGHHVLLHPSNANPKFVGQIGAVRVGQFKAVYHTGGVEACGEQIAGPFLVHVDPLVFDLSVDPEEQFPLIGQVKDEVVREASAALQMFLDSVRADNTSTVDYRVDPAVRPCCSHFLANCYCPWDEFGK